MIELVSPEHDLAVFCSKMMGRHPSEIMQSVSAEISYARHLHRDSTKEADFRKGSKGRKYCDDLQILLRMFMGSCPENPAPEFIAAITPLMRHVLTKWHIANVEDYFRQLDKQPVEPFGDPLIVVVSRQEVTSRNIEPALSTLRRLVSSPAVARANMEKLDIGFSGYDQHREELFEMTEVRDYVYELDAQFPYWLFFLSKQMLGLQCLAHCFLLPYLTEAAKAQRHPKQLESLLLDRWFPAMNQISDFAGLSEDENRRLTDRAMMYIMKGRLLTGGRA